MKSRDAIRAALLDGQGVFFRPDELVSERTVEAGWICEAVNNGKRVNVKGAVVVGPLNLRSSHVPAEFSMTQCRIAESADLAYATFARSLSFSGSTF